MIYILIGTGIFIADFFLKKAAEEHLTEHVDQPAFHNLLLLTKYHNEGAVLNIGSRKKAAVKYAAVVLTVIMTIVFLITIGKKGNSLLKAGLAMLLGGAFSNTYDRMHRGYVVDYFRLHVPNQSVQKLIFNVSDFFILIGSMITAVKMI